MYYLTFINNKIKDYYIVTYFLMLYVLLFVVSLYYIYTLLYREKEKADRRESERERKGRQKSEQEGTRAKDAANLFPVLPFRLPVPRSSLSFLPTERPAIASRSRGTPSPRWEGVHPVGFWAMPSPHLATTSPASDQQPATTGRRLDGLPSCPPRPPPRPLPLRQVVKVGRRNSQGGRSSPAHPVDPLHPAGVRPNICGHLRKHSGGRPAIAEGRMPFRENQSSQDNRHDGIALNINYLESPTGLQKH